MFAVFGESAAGLALSRRFVERPPRARGSELVTHPVAAVADDTRGFLRREAAVEPFEVLVRQSCERAVTPAAGAIKLLTPTLGCCARSRGWRGRPERVSPRWLLRGRSAVCRRADRAEFLSGRACGTGPRSTVVGRRGVRVVWSDLEAHYADTERNVDGDRPVGERVALQSDSRPHVEVVVVFVPVHSQPATWGVPGAPRPRTSRWRQHFG